MSDLVRDHSNLNIKATMKSKVQKKKSNSPANPYRRTETLNFEDSADGQRGGASMEANIFTVSPCKGAKPCFPAINKSGGTAEETLPPSTRAV